MNRICSYRNTTPTIILILVIIFLHNSDISIAQVFQQIEIPSTISPVGSGARAIGMGGAFIAVADDATAASWNPGGLIQLEKPELSVVGACFQRTEENNFGTNPEASGHENVYNNNINYLSVAVPFRLKNRNMVVSINYQYLYDFTREWNFPLRLEDNGLVINQDIENKQEGGLSAIGLAYCAQITKNLSLGLTLNFWEDSIYNNGWQQWTQRDGVGNNFGNTFYYDSYGNDKYSFRGFNTNIGFLWRISENLTVGGVVKTPFEGDLKIESEFQRSIIYPDQPDANSINDASYTSDAKLKLPMSYGIGLAYRFSDPFTFSLDIYRTNWDDYILTDDDGNKTSPITGMPLVESETEPTHQARMGAEYLFINSKYVLPARLGIFYDPAPTDGKPDDIYGFSLGSGIVINRVVFDVAYQYRYGNNVSTYIMESLDYSQDLNEHMMYGSIIIYL